ncbi:MAG: hypothetical protein LBQ44_04935 [Treponema sp.]|jgi:hypothetical protein|nr:hypothetical protein [Treponema sp.]
MKGKLNSGIFLLGIFLFCSGCAEVRAKKEIPPVLERIAGPGYSNFLSSVDILDYKDKASGAALAPWVRAYLDYGNQGVEALEDYRDYYAFVADQWGENTVLLEYWLRNFAVPQDFSRLVAVRIRRRFIKDLLRDPGDEYGGSYEAAVKAAYAVSFWGGRRNDNSWVLMDRYEGGLKEYHYFVLVLISREELQGQITEILNEIKTEGNTRYQNQAFDRIRETFFEDF